MLDHINASFEDKIGHSKEIIEEWYYRNKGKVYIAFSGGKDSTVMLHLVRSLFPDVKAVFANTGLEYPEIVKFVKTFENVDIVRPEKTFRDVLLDDGFPITNKRTARDISRLNNATEKNFNTRRSVLTGWVNTKNMFHPRQKMPKKWFNLVGADVKVTDACCDYLKKDPSKQWRKENKGFQPFIGMMMGEGSTREHRLLARNCNVFEGASASSVPLKFWTDKDVYRYANKYGVEICSVYKDFDLKRTGCTFCAYGANLEKGRNRFQKLRDSHPKQFNYFIHELGMGKALDYAGVGYGEEPLHTPPKIQEYTCLGCKEEYPLNEIGVITERECTQEEISAPRATMGMNLYCRSCAVKNGLPVSGEPQ